ncbi:MAG: NADH pyrophosphatase, partial [Pseudomonadota bacterium]|nr:NADH pyrophosphatase [Pseudomonadota bacterium]
MNAGAPPPYAFLAGALDRAEHLRDDPEALAAMWSRGRVLLLDDAGCARVDAHGALSTVAGADLGEAGADAVFLGLREGEGWFALNDAQADAARVDLRTAAATWPAFEATAYAQARAVLHWRARQRHCGTCGGALV